MKYIYKVTFKHTYRDSLKSVHVDTYDYAFDRYFSSKKKAIGHCQAYYNCDMKIIESKNIKGVYSITPINPKENVLNSSRDYLPTTIKKITLN